MQSTRRLQVLPGRVMALALGLFAALMLAGTFGFWLGGISIGHNENPPAFAAGAASEQITHNRSEEGLGSTGSTGAQQIAHDRDEQGLHS